MKILVTGANGQLGNDLVNDLSIRHQVVGLGRERLDVSNAQQAQDIVETLQPDVVIHAAAYTAVDLAETEEDNAYAVNTMGSRNIAIAAERIRAKVCYISTDYVFDGEGTSPYRECDQTNPQSIYGKSKRMGEEMVQSLSSQYYVVRTSWVYGVHGNNFPKTMLQMAEQRDVLRVVDDQVGSPTYTHHLTRFLEELIVSDQFGIYHASNAGTCSWFEFAKAIFEGSGTKITVEPCKTVDFPRRAPRPKYSVLDNHAIRKNGFSTLPHWRTALREFLDELRIAKGEPPGLRLSSSLSQGGSL